VTPSEARFALCGNTPAQWTENARGILTDRPDLKKSGHTALFRSIPQAPICLVWYGAPRHSLPDNRNEREETLRRGNRR